MATNHANREEVEIAVLARAPVPGVAKTRLWPVLGEVGAARLQRRLTLQSLRVARDAAIGGVTLWGAPDGRHRFFRALQRRCHLTIRAQVDGDLGARMAAVFAAHRGPLLLVGSDCPVLSTADLAAAASVLRQSGVDAVDAVFIPAEDGGYVLVGLRRPLPRLFEDIDWGSERVMTQTRTRLHELGLSWRELPTLWDIDRPQDLDRLASIDGVSRWLP